ncbi:unnamed protein product, partial [marine sediment metagenome]
MPEDLASYYANARPSYDFLKERLRPFSRDDIRKLIKQKNPVPGLDPYFLKDATEFLRHSILNLLAYKFLMCGNFLACGEVTIYYSTFYLINSMLRLKGFAVVHMDFPDEGSPP